MNAIVAAKGHGDMREQTAGGENLAHEEKQLRFWLIVGAVLFALEALIYIPEVFRGPAATRPYAINSVTKDFLFAALTALAAADLARRARLITLVIAGHVVIIVLLVLTLITGDTGFAFPPPRWFAALFPGLDPANDIRAISWLIAAVVATGLLTWLLHRALRARYDLRYLWPAEHAVLAGVADAILTEPLIPPEQIATKIDHYWASLDIGYKRRLRLSLWVVGLLPLLFLRPPLPLMERNARRRFIEKHFIADVISRSELGPLRTTVQSAIRFAMQLTYMGYYGDERSFPATGYVRFSGRPDFPREPPAPAPELRTKPLPAPREQRMRAEVVVVGTGAGGSIVARALARSGRDVLMLERGRHVRPSEFVEDEATQYASLYSDGALQLSRDFSFQVLQGMCVGGSTVVNNGVCFDLPDDVLERWNGPELNAGLSPEHLAAAFGEVRRLTNVVRQTGIRGNPIEARMPNAGFQAVEANLENCLGCGYCNIGCAFNRKLSMLTHVLPAAQRDADEHRERDPDFHGHLELLPDCEVTSVVHRDGRATGVICQLRLPDGGTRKLVVDADEVILAAGAIHSSRILMTSGIGGDLVGKGLAANLGSHMTACWPENRPLSAYDGLQMSHFRDGGSPAYRIETWFNPVMSQALVMPGWLGDHEQNMHRYSRLGCLGVIAGSSRNGNHVMRRRDFLSGAEIEFTPSIDDLKVLLGGLREAGRMLLDAGAECVMPATFAYHEFRSAEELARLDIGDLVTDASDISVNTGHPQGGNPISRDRARGVVDETLRVHGFTNLRVCDASVFPTAITVNPQLTVMALAQYAADTF